MQRVFCDNQDFVFEQQLNKQQEQLAQPPPKQEEQQQQQQKRETLGQASPLGQKQAEGGSSSS